MSSVSFPEFRRTTTRSSPISFPIPVEIRFHSICSSQTTTYESICMARSISVLFHPPSIHSLDNTGQVIRLACSFEHTQQTVNPQLRGANNQFQHDRPCSGTCEWTAASGLKLNGDFRGLVTFVTFPLDHFLLFERSGPRRPLLKRLGGVLSSWSAS